MMWWIHVLYFIGYSTVGNSYYQQTVPKAASNATVASDPNSQYVYQQTAYNPYQGMHNILKIIYTFLVHDAMTIVHVF